VLFCCGAPWRFAWLCRRRPCIQHELLLRLAILDQTALVNSVASQRTTNPRDLSLLWPLIAM